MSTPAIPISRQALSIEEAAIELGIGRTTAYQAARRGELPVLRIRRRMVVPRAALARLLAGDAMPARVDARRNGR